MRTIMITAGKRLNTLHSIAQLQICFDNLGRQEACNVIVDASRVIEISSVGLFSLRAAWKHTIALGGQFAVIPSRDLQRLMEQVGLNREITLARPMILPRYYLGDGDSSVSAHPYQARWCVDNAKSSESIFWLSTMLNTPGLRTRMMGRMTTAASSRPYSHHSQVPRSKSSWRD